MDDEAKSNIAEGASSATDKGREVARDASQQAKEVAGTAREQAGEVGHEAIRQGQRVVDEAKNKLHEQSQQQSAQVASTLREWSGKARALAEGRPEEAGPLSEYARQAAGKVTDAADRFEDRGFEGAIEDVKTFARRRPGVFLLGAGIAGFAAGRLLRGASSAPSTTGAVTTPISSGTRYAPYQPPFEQAPIGAAPRSAIETGEV